MRRDVRSALISDYEPLPCNAENVAEAGGNGGSRHVVQKPPVSSAGDAFATTFRTDLAVAREKIKEQPADTSAHTRVRTRVARNPPHQRATVVARAAAIKPVPPLKALARHDGILVRLNYDGPRAPHCRPFYSTKTWGHIYDAPADPPIHRRGSRILGGLRSRAAGRSKIITVYILRNYVS